MAQDSFVGPWKLIVFEYRRANGELIYPLGMGATGQLIYDASKRFSMQIARHDRPVFTSGYFKGLSPEELKVAVSGYFAYFGAYEVDEGEHTITHHVEGSLFPNWTGTSQVRRYEFAQNRLTLRKPPRAEGEERRTGTQIWEKVR